MTSDPRSARSEVIRWLMEAHERSSSFGQPGPWPCDVILAVDAKSFPSAFGPDGREDLASLCRGVEQLRGAGACWVVYEPSRIAQADLLPHQVHVGPGEITAADAIGAADGLAPLSAAIERVRRQIGELAPAPMALPLPS